MTREEIVKLLSHFSKEELRVMKYAVKDHSCAQGARQWCTECKLFLCAPCYMKHIKDVHPSARHFLERISIGSLSTQGKEQRDLQPKKEVAKRESKVRSKALSLTSKVDSLNEEELKKLLIAVRGVI